MIILVIGLSVGLTRSSSTTNGSGSTYFSVEMIDVGQLRNGSARSLVGGCDDIKDKDGSNLERSIKDILVSIKTICTFIKRDNISISYSCR